MEVNGGLHNPMLWFTPSGWKSIPCSLSQVLLTARCVALPPRKEHDCKRSPESQAGRDVAERTACTVNRHTDSPNPELKKHLLLPYWTVSAGLVDGDTWLAWWSARQLPKTVEDCFRHSTA